MSKDFIFDAATSLDLDGKPFVIIQAMDGGLYSFGVNLGDPDTQDSLNREAMIKSLRHFANQLEQGNHRKIKK